MTSNKCDRSINIRTGGVYLCLLLDARPSRAASSLKWHGDDSQWRTPSITYWFSFWHWHFSIFFVLFCIFLCQDLLRVSWLARFENLQLHRARRIQQLFPLQCFQNDKKGMCISIANASIFQFLSWYSVTKIRRRMRMPPPHHLEGNEKEMKGFRVEFEPFRSRIRMETGHTHTHTSFRFYIFHSCAGYIKKRFRENKKKKNKKNT
jgi:hypothetical protein